MDLFNTPSINLLTKNLDGLWKRQEVISDNIANFETPGYKRKYVSFEENLIQAVQNSNKKSIMNQKIDNTEIQVNQADDETMRLDGNNVDIEKENLEMARTSMNYMYSQRILNDYFSRLKNAISEGRK